MTSEKKNPTRLKCGTTVPHSEGVPFLKPEFQSETTIHANVSHKVYHHHHFQVFNTTRFPRYELEKLEEYCDVYIALVHCM